MADADAVKDGAKVTKAQLARSATARPPADSKPASDSSLPPPTCNALRGAMPGINGADHSPAPSPAPLSTDDLPVQIGNPSGPPLTMHCGACCIPHVDRTDSGGEDAHFITSAGLGAVGVADGVGSWSEDGIDPAEYSRRLMVCCREALESTEGQADALQVLQYAQENTNVEGSSTACIALLRPGGLLEVANLGDSGLRVIRGHNCVFATEAQEHDFNQPYQLAHPQLVAFTDLASDAQVTHVQLRPGDVVVLGSDGLFNNMWERQLLDVVNTRLHQLRGRYTPEAARQVAADLAAAAHANAKKRFFRSPFGVEAASRGLGSLMFRLLPLGGKMDDTTVVVCLVARLPEEPAAQPAAQASPSS